MQGMLYNAGVAQGRIDREQDIVQAIIEMRDAWLVLAEKTTGSGTYFSHKARVCNQILEAITKSAEVQN